MVQWITFVDHPVWCSSSCSDHQHRW